MKKTRYLSVLSCMICLLCSCYQKTLFENDILERGSVMDLNGGSVYCCPRASYISEEQWL